MYCVKTWFFNKLFLFFPKMFPFWGSVEVPNQEGEDLHPTRLMGFLSFPQQQLSPGVSEEAVTNFWTCPGSLLWLCVPRTKVVYYIQLFICLLSSEGWTVIRMCPHVTKGVFFPPCTNPILSYSFYQSFSSQELCKILVIISVIRFLALQSSRMGCDKIKLSAWTDLGGEKEISFLDLRVSFCLLWSAKIKTLVFATGFYRATRINWYSNLLCPSVPCSALSFLFFGNELSESIF